MATKRCLPRSIAAGTNGVKFGSGCQQALQSVREYVALDSGEPMFFGNVLARQHRHDLKLDLTPQVMEATDQLLGALAPTIASC